MIKGLAHVCFIVSDLDKSIDFYQHRLGLTPAFDFFDDKGVRFGLYLHVGERTFLELFVGKVDARADGQSYRHLCLEVDNVDATAAELRTKGVEVSPTKMGGDNSWQAWLTDPDGNRIELHQYTPQSKQTPWAK